MKRNSVKSIAIGLLSMLLSFICLASFLIVPITAATATKKDYEYKTDYKTTDRKPTYTETLNENNRLLKELTKKENVVLQKVRNEGKDWVSDTFKLLKSMKDASDSDAEVDVEKICVETGKNLINTIAGIWGFDGISGAALEGLEELTSSGKAPLSEIQILSDNINHRFNEISDQLYDIEDQLGELSGLVSASANAVLSGSGAQINDLAAKEILRAFMTSGEGNFSYTRFSNYLYGSKSSSVNPSEAYYILLLEAIEAGASDELIKYYYDKLFDSIYTELPIFHQYYIGDITGLDQSIAAYYYDYLSSNPDLVAEGTTAEYQALLFALDLYTSYVYAYEILEICFAYQLTEMFVDAWQRGEELREIDTYAYAENKLINYRTILEKIDSMQKDLVLAEEQAVADIAYILSMKDSYVAVDKNGDSHSIGNYGDSFGNIADGQTIYLNVIPDDIAEMFLVDNSRFAYYINDTLYSGQNRGVISEDDIGAEIFVASVRYGTRTLYGIEFRRIDAINAKGDASAVYAFSGGSGRIDDPYLISNAIQFDMIQNDLDASYRLIADIALSGTRSPIGTEKKPFNGSLDGNGYTVSSLAVESLPYDSTNITMTPSTGMFGTISRYGEVKNLTLSGLTVVSDYSKDGVNPENAISYYFVGGIAGTNRGIISNCSIVGASSILVNRSKSMQESRCVSIFVGGIAGSSSGIIEYCKVDSLTVNARSHLWYYTESASQNEHLLYVGGIAATTTGDIQNCRVSENVSLSAYAKSIAESKEDVKPYLTVCVGGVVADDSAKELLKQVYSACRIEKCEGDLYNDGEYWGAHRYSWDNVSVSQGLYYPVFFPITDSEELSDVEYNVFLDEYNEIFREIYAELVRAGWDADLASYQAAGLARPALKKKLIEDEAKAKEEALQFLSDRIVPSSDSAVFFPDGETAGIEIVLTDDLCKINTAYLSDCFDRVMDKEKKILNAKFVDENGQQVKASIVGYYGFNTYHEKDSEQSITVKVLFYVDDALMSDDVTLRIEGKTIAQHQVEGFIESSFDRESDPEKCLDEIFSHGFKLVYVYSNRQREEIFVSTQNRDSFEIRNLVTTEYGTREIEIVDKSRPEQVFKASVVFACHHTQSDFVFDRKSEPSCQFPGYEVWKCQKDGIGCGEIITKNYVTGDHSYVVKSGQAASCQEPGYTQEVYCSVCQTEFESSEWIQALAHSYVSSSDAGYAQNDAYPASEYHYCKSGDHYEAHQYTVRETIDEKGTLVYLYSCFCGYENPVPDENIKTKENGERPIVVLTNGYVLGVGDKVVVYVQILNNPGFKGASFGIRYTEGLELISAEEGSIVPQQLKTKCEVYGGYNFLWAEGNGNQTREDGYLLKLTFRYTDSRLSEQTVSVVYGMSNGSDGGFCTLDDEYHMFMTRPSTVSVVEHLPGDVNGDDLVDIMDATYIAWSIVGKTDENGNRITVNAGYADVNLDGKVDLLDVLAILQSISGRYGTNLLSSAYPLLFDLGGFEVDGVDGSVLVKFYDEDGRRTKWSENVDFEKYESLMNQLGYTFVGWYTRMSCSCQSECLHFIKADELVRYDPAQSRQTLYARWEKNKIVFDMGGANCEPFDEIVYTKAEHDNAVVTLKEPFWSYDLDFIVDGDVYGNGRIYREFLGWIDENGKVVSEIDLSKANLGTLTLKASWSEYRWITPDVTERGYHPITLWYMDVYRKTPITDLNDSDVAFRILSGGAMVYSKRTPIEYTVSFAGTENLTNSNSTKYTIENELQLKPLSDRIGYKFDGWYDANGNKVESIAKGSVGDVALTAKWKAKVYTITMQGVDVNPSGRTDGKGNPKYDARSFATLYFVYGDETHERGFYLEATLATRLTMAYFDEYVENNEGKTHFTFGGLYNSAIENNGHSYAVYSGNALVLSSALELIADPLLSEDLQAGTLYVLLAPKTYDITFNLNKPSYGETSSSGYTEKISVYYNENLSGHKITMPTNTYFKAVYRYDGVDYFGFDGTSDKLASFEKNVEFTAYWGTSEPISSTEYHTAAYSDIYYIKNGEDLSQIRNYSDKSFILLCDITLSGQWTPIPSFSGTLNGNNKNIHRLSLDYKNQGAVSSELNVGFFAKMTSSARVYDLSFHDASIYWDPQHGGGAWLYAGVLVGSGNGSVSNVKIYNSNVTVHRDSAAYGSIAGRWLSGTISNSHAYGVNIYGNGDGGGLVGNLSGTLSYCNVDSSSSRRSTVKHYANSNTRSNGGICGYSNGGTIQRCVVSNTDFILDGNLSLCTNMGIIVGHASGGNIHHVDRSGITQKWIGTMYKDNGLFGIGNFDYRTNWFRHGWGYAGALSNSPSVQ